MLEKEENDDGIAEQLRKITTQLDFKKMYEDEQKRCSKLEKKLLELQNENMHREEVRKKEMLEKECLMHEETLKQETLTKELKEEIVLKNLTYEKKWESHTSHYNKTIDAFNKQLKDSEEAHKNEICNLQVKMEELKKEVAKTLKDSAEAHRREMLENIHLRDEDNNKHNNLIEKLQEEIEQLKNQLTLFYKQQATEGEDSLKNLQQKELKTREEIYEKSMKMVIDTFSKQLKDSEDHLQHKIQECIREEVKKLENTESTVHDFLFEVSM